MDSEKSVSLPRLIDKAISPPLIPYFDTTIMTFHEFTYNFIPRLAHAYNQGELPLYSLFDHELWKQLFPVTSEQQGELVWERMRFTAHSMDDGTLLIVYDLPIPTKAGEDKYIALRLNRQEHRVVIYTLRRPKYYNEQWDIYQLSLPDGKSHFDVQMPDARWELTDFCRAVNRLPFDETLGDGMMDNAGGGWLFEVIKNGVRRLFDGQG